MQFIYFFDSDKFFMKFLFPTVISGHKYSGVLDVIFDALI